MKSFYLSLPGDILIEVRNSAGLNFDTRAQILGKAYVPGLQLVDRLSREPDITIECLQPEDQKFIRQEKAVLISANWMGETSLDFYHLLYSAARIEWLKRDLFPVHAACVGKDEYILIVGHSGAGKTSIVLELLHNQGLLLFSGNKTLVSFEQNKNLNAVAGTQTLTAKVEDLKRHLKNTQKIIEYNNRGALVLDEKYLAKSSGPIKAMIIVQLNDGSAEHEKLSPAGALHRLYPYFLDTVNADTTLLNGRGVFVGTPPAGTQQKLAAALTRTLLETPTYFMSGSMSFLVNAIKSI